MSKLRVLVLDIETAPNEVAVYSLKQKYINPQYIMSAGYVLCFSAQWLGEEEMHFARSPDGHLEMLQKVHALLSNADAVVHYYGKKFDIPTLNAEFLLHRMPPLPPIVQIDLYHLCRRTFNFPSYKLDYVCSRLGIGRKARHAGWEMWKACIDNLHEKHATAWVVMERYNKRDIKMTAALYRRLRPWFAQTYEFKRIHEWLEGHRTKP